MRAAWWLPFLLIVSVPTLAQDAEALGSAAGSYPAWNFLRHHGFTGALRLDYFRSSKDLDNATDLFGVTTQVKLTPIVSRASIFPSRLGLKMGVSLTWVVTPNKSVALSKSFDDLK